MKGELRDCVEHLERLLAEEHLDNLDNLKDNRRMINLLYSYIKSLREGRLNLPADTGETFNELTEIA